MKTNTVIVDAVLVVLAFGCFIEHARGCGRGSIYITNNEYKQVLIAIAENVPEDVTLLDRIKEVFTEASEFLYTVTRFRAYFKEITILVPKSWSDSPDYEPLGNETFDKSDIVVDFPDDQYGSGDSPFVIKTTPCGELGYYMHLTPNYLLNPEVAEQYGPYAKVLIHEWAHLRYGVYDEYPVGDNAQHFYAVEEGNIEGTRCSRSLPGSMYNPDSGSQSCDYINGLPEPSCRWMDAEGFPPNYGSLMYRQYLDHIQHFCDNDPTDVFTFHNAEAPTQQNLLCDSRSVWEVLESHPDFADGNNPPVEIGSTEPDFRVVRQKEKRTVLVLDTSGSMNDNDRIGKLNQGCNTYITSIARDGEEIGIVTFSQTADADIELTTVNAANRPTLVDHLPTSSNGWTSIGSGIEEALDMLERGGGTDGGTLIVVSDGVENRSPYISDVIDRVFASKVTLHSIAITQATDTALDAIALATGGLAFLYSETDTSNAINEAFQAIGELNQNPSERNYQIQSQASTMAGRETVMSTVVIDQTLGKNTEFTFDYAESRGIDVVLTSPSGVQYNTDQASHDTTFFIYRFTFPGIAEIGTWNYSITNKENGAQRVAVTVTSQPAKEGEYPIIAQAFWAKRNINLGQPGNGPDKQALYVSVSKGYVPVLNADVEATVDRPGTAGEITRKLYDNGAGADLVKDDGIYSRYFVGFNANGRYNVRVTVDSNPTTVISPTKIIGTGAAGVPGAEGRQQDVPTGDFQRLASGGTFELSGYTPGTVYPPGQVMDLKVAGVDHDTGVVTLQWTAMGQQLDEGQADSYDIRYSSAFISLKNYFSLQPNISSDMITGINLTSPAEAGIVETASIQMPEIGGITYHFALKAVADQGISPVSNIASVSMKDNRVASSSNVGLIVGIVFGVLGYMALVAFVVYLVTHLKPSSVVGNSPADTENGNDPGVPGVAFSGFVIKTTKSTKTGKDNLAYTEDEHKTSSKPQKKEKQKKNKK